MSGTNSFSNAEPYGDFYSQEETINTPNGFTKKQESSRSDFEDFEADSKQVDNDTYYGLLNVSHKVINTHNPWHFIFNMKGGGFFKM